MSLLIEAVSAPHRVLVRTGSVSDLPFMHQPVLFLFPPKTLLGLDEVSPPTRPSVALPFYKSPLRKKNPYGVSTVP